MHLSPSGLAFLESLEALRLTAYLDDARHGVPTIGYGHTAGVTQKDVPARRTITRQEAARYLASDVAWAEGTVNRRIRSKLSVSQFDALVCFAFNVGAPAFWQSTLAARADLADWAEASGEFPKWIHHDGGRISDGLVKRRKAERTLFDMGVYTNDPYA